MQTRNELVESVRALFLQNKYEVEGPLKVAGAEVDLRAKSKTDIFSPNIYIEVTEQYVDTTKYGKDVTKFIMLREKEADSKALIVSLVGFTPDVAERAKASRIETLTYQELFKKFQQFAPYVDLLTGTKPFGVELSSLNGLYEESTFDDAHGKHPATKYLTDWKNDPMRKHPWIVVVGDYGSGKTALSKVLQYRWVQEYTKNPNLPIPFRIELSSFARQFDARGLINRFLESNELAHLSPDFVETLIASGKVVLILDGYDEMAQHMHVRERRACLQALAELTKGGAIGIITSRPNYFTEAEELRILEAIYRTLSAKYQVQDIDRGVLAQEGAVDELLKKQFLERFERNLVDLDNKQTRHLIERALPDDKEGRETVIKILDRVARDNADGTVRSLSGKPVIISYLLAIVEELKNAKAETKKLAKSLGEWEIYSLILDKLMLRDFGRSSHIIPSRRRQFLETLACKLSATPSSAVSETQFIDIVRSDFQPEIDRYPTDTREDEVQRFFADLRSSATLTRKNAGAEGQVWCFSHNSLREYLAASSLANSLLEKNSIPSSIPITEAMQIFIGSRAPAEISPLLSNLQQLIKANSRPELGRYVSLFWKAGLRNFKSDASPAAAFLKHLTGSPISVKGLNLDRIEIRNCDLAAASFSETTIVQANFTGSNLSRSDFSSSSLEATDFSECNLSAANFANSLLIDVNVTSAKLEKADFRGADARVSADGVTYSGNDALGLLAAYGAITDSVPLYCKLRHHPDFPVVEKICRKLTEQGARQEYGLTQRGVSNQNPTLAKRFVEFLKAKKLAEAPKRGLIKLSDNGRTTIGAFIDHKEMTPLLGNFFN